MATLLHKQEKITCQVAFDFYFRRFKRIVPIYLIVIASSLLLTLFFLCHFDYQRVLDDLKPALYFWSNMAVLFMKDDYFKQVSFYYCDVNTLINDILAIFHKIIFTFLVFSC
jgi:peptidoglycan/LPS O-acetylase OafA/YrhL